MNKKLRNALLAVGISMPLYYYFLPERIILEEKSHVIKSVDNLDVKMKRVLREVTEAFDEEMLLLQPFIHQTSTNYTVPEETILAAGYVEYVRMHTSTIEDVTRSREGVRTYIKSILTTSSLGERVLKMMGRSTGYGHVHAETLEQALQHPLSAKLTHMTTTSQQEQQIVNAAEVLRLHQVLWTKAGYDIYAFPFTTIHSFGERVALHVTLYNGFAFTNKKSFGKEDPRIGGTYIPNLDLTYSDLVMIYTTHFFEEEKRKKN